MNTKDDAGVLGAALKNGLIWYLEGVFGTEFFSNIESGMGGGNSARIIVVFGPRSYFFDKPIITINHCCNRVIFSNEKNIVKF